MPKPRAKSGEKNLIRHQLIELRHMHRMSQRDVARELQLLGYDIDKGTITSIETGKRYVTDFEVRAIAQIFQVSYAYLLGLEEE